MSHPYLHSLSSAKKFGGNALDYLDLHSLVDSTKAHLADARHRLLLHNAWGIFLVERIYGVTLTRLSDGKVQPVRPLLEKHVQEDFGKIPTLDECLGQLPRDSIRETWDQSWQHACMSAERYGGAAQDYLPIHQLLNSPRDVINDTRARVVLHNAWGISIVARVFGEIAFRASDGQEFSPREVAWSHIVADLGTVPSLEESLKGIELQSWMYRKAEKLSDQFEGGYSNTIALARRVMAATGIPLTIQTEQVSSTPEQEVAHV